MARWRTHNKRRRRREVRNATFMRDFEGKFQPLLEEVVRKAFATAAYELVKQIQSFAALRQQAPVTAFRSAPLEWQTQQKRIHARNQWPEIVYEDILDAEYVED